MAANKPDFSKIYEKITDQIIAEMEKGIIPWKKGMESNIRRVQCEEQQVLLIP